MKTLIIGGTTGIGAAVADHLTTDAYYTGEGESEVHTPDPEFLDVTKDSSIASFITSQGPFEGIVYSAGFNRLSWIGNMDRALMERTFAINTFGLPMVARAHEHFYPEQSVNCVAIVSDASETPMRGSLAYCASKAAMVSVVKNMARELGPRWRVNGVSPGVVDDTDMTKYIDEKVPGFRGWTKEQAQSYENSNNALGRRVRKNEIAETVEFLLCGPAAINGEIITINGKGSK